MVGIGRTTPGGPLTEELEGFMSADYRDVQCRMCKDWFEDDDFDGEDDEFICGRCERDRDEAIREDMAVAKRKYGEYA